MLLGILGFLVIILAVLLPAFIVRVVILKFFRNGNKHFVNLISILILPIFLYIVDGFLISDHSTGMNGLLGFIGLAFGALPAFIILELDQHFWHKN
jgi:hypothetical protein